ncbi:MAG: metallophosphoesterase [Lachnospiraceae bacterium]|nr:metallophosphoesterase [Lachnospiraceae bacterium]
MLAMLSVLWTVWGNVTVGVTRYSITSERLPTAFEGYKIVVISDLHNAQFGNDNSRIIQIVKKEQPDLIAITGDLVDSNRTDVQVAVATVRELQSIAPCCFVTGNHEGWIGTQYPELEEKLLAENVHILHDRCISIERDGQKIQLAGLDDPDFTERSNLDVYRSIQTMLKQMLVSEDYSILLSHRPELFEVYVEAGVDLVLSGHAHGGQIRLPFVGGIVAPDQGLFPKYDAGIYTRNGTKMIVSRGIGNSIIPIRINNRPEIVVVELK